MTTATRTGMAVLVAVAMSCAACGPDGSDVYTAPAPTETEPSDTRPSAAASTDPLPDEPATPVESVEPNGEVVNVRALDNSFIAEEIEITAGTEVRWENRGRNDHDVVPVDDTQDWGVALADFTPGDSYSHVFTTTGTFRYYCTIHGTADFGMIGAVVVD